MIEHFDDDLLFDYLDDRLDAALAWRLQTHLQQCALCRRRLAAHEGLYMTLAELPELPFDGDVAAAVQAAIGPRPRIAPALWRLGQLQLLLLTGLLWLMQPQLLSVALPALDWFGERSALIAWWTALRPSLQLPALPSVPAALDLPLLVAVLLLAAALFVWVAGSRIILSSVPRAER